METRNDVPDLLVTYIRDTREIYDITAWSRNTLIKKKQTTARDRN